MKLSREVAELLKAGVIEQDTADRIEQYYLAKAGPPQNKLVIVFGILGSLLVGLGIVLITLAGWVLYHQSIDWAGALGMALIVAGVAVIQLFSKSTGH